MPATHPRAIRKDVTYLNVLLACILVDEGLTVLNNQGFLKRELKQQASRMCKELEKVISDDVPLIVGENDALLYALIDAQREMMIRVANMRPEDAFAITEIIKRYEEDPLSFQELLGITFIEGDDPRASKGEGFMPYEEAMRQSQYMIATRQQAGL